MAKGKTPKQLEIKINSLKKQVVKLEQQRKRALEAAKKKVAKKVVAKKAPTKKVVKKAPVKKKVVKKKAPARRR